MSSKDKVLFYLCGDRNKASSRVRGYWVAETLEEQGVECSLEYRHTRLALIWFLMRIPFYQKIIFQKSYSRWHCLILRFARFLKKTTILDLDDAPSRTNHPVTLRNVEFMMRNVSAVTVGSKVLFDYTSKYSQNVHLIPSCIYLKYYEPHERKKQENDSVCLGWIGNGKHYKSDLTSTLREPLTEIAGKYPIRFKLIGACGEKELYESFNDINGLKVDFIDQIEWSDPKAVSTAISDFDIGLYPLLPNEFNKYKCGFKALEYMAMQIPVVSSDVAENREIVENGVDGFLVNSKNEWIKVLCYLIEDEGLRVRMGKAGREKVRAFYNVDKTAVVIKSIISDIEGEKTK